MKAAASSFCLFLACAHDPVTPPVAPLAPPQAPRPVAVAPPAPPRAAPAPPLPDGPPSPGAVLVGQVVGPSGFDPNPALEGLKPAMLKCYTDARLLVPDLHGKLSLEVHVNGAGAVSSVEGAGGPASDPGLLGCLGDALKQATFPKPPGIAILTVPLVFRQ